MDYTSLAVLAGTRRTGISPKLAEAAGALAALISTRAMSVVCSGVNSGLLGCFLNSATAANIEVEAIIVNGDQERGNIHPALCRVIVVESEGERKKMLMRAGGFVALPGGLGTIDEIVSILLENMNNTHPKRIYLVNVDNFYGSLVGFFKDIVAKKFVEQKHLNSVFLVNSIDELGFRLSVT